MTNFTDIYYQSPDQLRLYARDYRCTKPNAETLLLMHGLSRNSADFADLAQALKKNFRVIVVDQRGRGNSSYDSNVNNYNPAVYVQDMFCLLDHLNISSVSLIGTSMGGLMAMIMASMQPQRINSIVINDIGPVVNPAGLERIKSYLGKTKAVHNWQQAIDQCKQLNAKEFPDFDDNAWKKFTHALYKENSAGIPQLAYDPAIATPIDSNQANAVPVDLWPTFDALAQSPLLLIRGESSDILSRDCVKEMLNRKPDMQFIEIANRGHAPLLNEAAAVQGIERFLIKNCA